MKQIKFGQPGQPPHLRQLYWNTDENGFFGRTAFFDDKNNDHTQKVYDGRHTLVSNISNKKIKYPYDIDDIDDIEYKLFFMKQKKQGSEDWIIFSVKDGVVYGVEYKNIIGYTDHSIDKFLNYYYMIINKEITAFDVFSLYEL